MKCAIYIYSIILSNFHSPTSSTISSFSTLAMIQLQTHSSSITSYEKRFELTLESSDKIMQLIERILGERKFKKREEERKNTDGHLENGWVKRDEWFWEEIDCVWNVCTYRDGCSRIYLHKKKKKRKWHQLDIVMTPYE